MVQYFELTGLMYFPGSKARFLEVYPAVPNFMGIQDMIKK